MVTLTRFSLSVAGNSCFVLIGLFFCSIMGHNGLAVDWRGVGGEHDMKDAHDLPPHAFLGCGMCVRILQIGGGSVVASAPT